MVVNMVEWLAIKMNAKNSINITLTPPYGGK